MFLPLFIHCCLLNISTEFCKSFYFYGCYRIFGTKLSCGKLLCAKMYEPFLRCALTICVFRHEFGFFLRQSHVHKQNLEFTMKIQFNPCLTQIILFYSYILLIHTQNNYCTLYLYGSSPWVHDRFTCGNSNPTSDIESKSP